jgi:hypothetical protein
VALKDRILLVSFAPSHNIHNQRLAKLLGKSFIVEHLTLFNSSAKNTKTATIRIFLSRFVSFLSIPVIAVLLSFQKFLFEVVLRKRDKKCLSQAIQSYFNNQWNFTCLAIHLNKTLRHQKAQVTQSLRVTEFALKFKATCVVLPEDSNFYATGLIIQSLQNLGIVVGVVDFTVGKESEFELSREILVPDRHYRPYSIFARIMLDSEQQNRWNETKEFFNCFPGSLETSSYSSLKPGFGSGLANFYLSSDVNELDYLRRIANVNSQYCLIEPIELTLAKTNINLGSEKNVFGIFLPPNQLTDPNVIARMQGSADTDYQEMLQGILSEARKVCGNDEFIVVFPHPRTYASDPELIDKISEDFILSSDFSDHLGSMRFALIFSSAVFSALLAADVKVFNLDLYNYGYSGVFPIGCENFIEINRIDELKSIPHLSTGDSCSSVYARSTVTEFLKSYL